jgi:hypothetical protein
MLIKERGRQKNLATWEISDVPRVGTAPGNPSGDVRIEN